jgi:Na+/H+-dicarboxylate symporter
VKWLDLAALAGVAVVFVGLHVLRRRRLNFSLLTLIALAVGIPVGLAARGHVSYVEPIGRIYVNVLMASVAPLIVVAIVSSVVSLGSVAKLRSIGLRSVVWLMASNAIAVVLALGVGLGAHTGAGVHETLGGQQLSVLQNSVQDFTKVVVDFFPVNVFGDLSANHIIPIILISLTVSIAYLSLAERDAESVEPFRRGVEALKLVIFKAVGFVIGLTPYAIVALTATVVANSADLQSKFWSLIGLLGLTWATCAVHTFVVNAVILRVFADVSPASFFRKIFPAQLTALTTQSSVGTLPVTTDVLTRRVGVHPEIAHFTAPLGTTIGMPGCSGIWPILIAVWGINAYDISYSAQDYVVLALLGVVVSVGTAGVPGTATVAAATVFAAAGLPLDFIAVTLPISAIADMARTATNVTAAAVSATVVARQTDLLDDAVFDGTGTYDGAEPVLVGRHASADPSPTDHDPEAATERTPAAGAAVL